MKWANTGAGCEIFLLKLHARYPWCSLCCVPTLQATLPVAKTTPAALATAAAKPAAPAQASAAPPASAAS